MSNEAQLGGIWSQQLGPASSSGAYLSLEEALLIGIGGLLILAGMAKGNHFLTLLGVLFVTLALLTFLGVA
jgi:hypothetical protein